jgi:hypothetical protein
MRPGTVVGGEPSADPGPGLAAVGTALQGDVLVFERAPGAARRTRCPSTAHEILMPAAISVPVKAALVNSLPWSVLKISGLSKRARASSSAET